MYLLSFYICVFISVTHETLLKNLPTSDDIRKSKINYHRQTVCMIKVGKEVCYNASKSPGDPVEISKLIIMTKDESLKLKDKEDSNDDTDDFNNQNYDVLRDDNDNEHENEVATLDAPDDVNDEDNRNIGDDDGGNQIQGLLGANYADVNIDDYDRDENDDYTIYYKG